MMPPGDGGVHRVIDVSRCPTGGMPNSVAMLARITEGSFRSVAALRGAPALHPVGMTLRGAAELVGTGAGLVSDERSTCDVVVRLSRGIGWRAPLPDFLGVAVRFVDAHGAGEHQDLLLTSVLGHKPVVRHALFPVPRFNVVGFSTVLPYRASGAAAVAAGRTDGGSCSVLLGAEPLRPGSFHEVRTTLQAREPVEIALSIGRLRGTWQPTAMLRLRTEEPPVADALRFDPWNSGPDLVPSGALNRLRRPAYAGSREGATGVRRPS